MSNHTPGPWIQAGPSYGDKFPRYTDEIVTNHDPDDDSPQTICSFDGCFDEENEANARLIAAAPDLLDALINMTDIAEQMVSWFPENPNANGPLIQARAAIEKATRETK